MAKTIATVGGVALAPGISRNGRLYTKAHIAGMVARVQDRIASGNSPVLEDRDKPIEDHVVSQRTHHAAEDDSTKIVGRVTSISLDESGRARFKADIPDTSAGRDIANLLDTSDGKPAFLRGVSGRMAWLTGARITRGPNGQPVETGDELDLVGLDYTHKPGVPDAAVDTFEWTSGGTRTETTERVLIYESVQEAHVTAFTEETTADTGDKSCAELGHACCKTSSNETAPAAVVGLMHLLADGLCVTCGIDEAAKDKKKPYGDVQYADPGYMSDGVKRYPLDSETHTRAAWSFISQKANAAKYTAAQLKRIKQKIKSAMKTIGAKVSETAEGWVVFPTLFIPDDTGIAECYDIACDPRKSGSYCLNVSNGATNITISSYSVDPADLDLIARAAADAVCAALKELDPDMDGDTDVPGADAEDTDGDAGESAPSPAQAHEATESTPAPVAAAGESTETEGTPLPQETTSTAAADTSTAATFTLDQVNETVSKALAAAESARLARKAAKRAGKQGGTAPAETQTGGAPVAETSNGAGAGQAPVTESEDDAVKRMVAAKLAELYPEETAEERLQRKVSETFDAEIARLTQAGRLAVNRKGVVRTANETAAGGGTGAVHESTGLPVEAPDKPWHLFNAEEFGYWGSALTGAYVLGDRVGKIA